MADPEVLALPFTPIPTGSSYFTVVPLVNAILAQPEVRVITPSYSPTALYNVPTFTFYLTHQPSGKTILFDLGIDFRWRENFEEDLKAFISDGAPNLIGDVGEMLREGGATPKDVSAVIISHRHWDHTGNISPFPDAEIVGGKDVFDGDLGRQVRIGGHKTLAIDFEKVKTSKIGAFEHAYDYLRDGSIWICDSAGHTGGHVSALVRTTPAPNASYVLLSGDTCHHPILISPSSHHFTIPTYPARLTSSGHPRQHPALPPPCCMHFDKELAWKTIMRTRRMELEKDVMVVLAHDYVLWRLWKAGEGRLWPGRKGIQGWEKEGLKVPREYKPEEYEKQ